MKTIAALLLLLAVTLSAAERLPVASLPLTTGRTLSEVEFLDVTEKGARVKHQRGTQVLRFTEVDLAGVKALTGLDPAGKPAHRSVAALLAFDEPARPGESKTDHRTRLRVHLKELDQQIEFHWSKVAALSGAAKKNEGAASAVQDHAAMAFALEVSRCSLKGVVK